MDKVKAYISLTEGIDESALEAAISRLPDWRRAAIAKRTAADKINGAFSYLLLNYLTMKEYKLSDSAPFTYGGNGKPYFSSIGLFFSISHCRTAVGAAVSKSEMGFDLVDNRKINEGITRIICCDDEMRAFEACEDKQRFLRLLWCRKESAVKKTGIGFREGFKTVNTELLPYKIFSTENYIAAVCGGGDCEFKEIDWHELLK